MQRNRPFEQAVRERAKSRCGLRQDGNHDIHLNITMKQPSIYIPHGGGPCFFMPPPPDEPTRWVGLENYLRKLPEMLPRRPDALLIVSGHWEMQKPTVLAAPKPALLFDYFGFPPHTYQLKYPAPGAPELASQVRRLLADAGMDSGEDLTRGYDHGIFVPLKVMFPEADIPILQLSLQTGLDPARHIAIGNAISSLRNQNVLIIGSGLSFHNLSAMGDPRALAPARSFDRWLVETLCDGPVESRERALAKWSQAPGGRECHPREEHLLPLMVAAGAASGESGRHVFSDTIWGKPISAFHFG
jgi:aromatic ring-opening dioxygenase catalytic subunit (LigB family)